MEPININIPIFTAASSVIILFVIAVNIFALFTYIKRKYLALFLILFSAIPSLMFVFSIFILYTVRGPGAIAGLIWAHIALKIALFIPYFFPIVLYKALRNKIIFILCFLPYLIFILPGISHDLSVITLKNSNPPFAPSYLPLGTVGSDLPEFEHRHYSYLTRIYCGVRENIQLNIRLDIYQELVNIPSNLPNSDSNNNDLREFNQNLQANNKQTYQFNGQKFDGIWYIQRSDWLPSPIYRATFYDNNGTIFRIYLDGKCLNKEGTTNSSELDSLALSEMNKIVSGLKQQPVNPLKDYINLLKSLLPLPFGNYW